MKSVPVLFFCNVSFCSKNVICKKGIIIIIIMMMVLLKEMVRGLHFPSKIIF